MVKRKKFNFAKYTQDQIVDALTCPLNRWATKEEHDWCSDADLHKHPEWLIQHYIEKGGADYWATKRREYETEYDEPEEDYQI